MLAALLLAAIVAAPLATIVLFLGSPAPPGVAARRNVIGHIALALGGTVVLAAVTAATLQVIGVTRRNLVAAIVGLVVMSLVWLPATRRWSARSHLCWSATVLLFVSYLAFMLQWTFASHLAVAATAGSLLLWLLELGAAVLGCAYLWELCDTLGLESWRRRVDLGAASADRKGPEGPWPFVSLQVPAYNEPPEMVIETLRSLKALDYDNYEIIAVDDNSDDKELWRPLSEWCLDNGVKFAHLTDWPGYKSGALNYALHELTDPRAELIGVVDADYQLDRGFLRQCAPLFNDARLGFIQAPQDYRDWQQAPFYRRLYYSYRYFFAVSQPSRNERDGAIFAGTMGLIRRRALEEVGGWDEWCITEDAELSLRLLQRGYTGLHIDASFGKGVMPLTFEALKGQRFRWCFGGVQILRRHWRSLLPGPKTADNQLDLGQRWAYLSGAIQWYGDLLALVFFAFLLVGAANVALGGGLLFRKLTGFLVAAIPLMFALGLVRAIGLVRRGAGASWRNALGALMIWQSTSLVVARACVQGIFAKKAEFLRTPKTGEAPSVLDAVKGNRGETLLALLGLAGIAAGLTHTSGYAGLLTAGLLVWPTLAFAGAPFNSLAARRAVLPPELSARRRTEFMRSPARRGFTVAAGMAFAGGMVFVVAALLAPGSANVVVPQLVRPAQGHHVQYDVARPTTTTSVPATTSVPPATTTTLTTGTSPPTSAFVSSTTLAPATTAPSSTASSTPPSTSGSATPAPPGDSP